MLKWEINKKIKKSFMSMEMMRKPENKTEVVEKQELDVSVVSVTLDLDRAKITLKTTDKNTGTAEYRDVYANKSGEVFFFEQTTDGGAKTPFGTEEMEKAGIRASERDEMLRQVQEAFAASEAFLAHNYPNGVYCIFLGGSDGDSVERADAAMYDKYTNTMAIEDPMYHHRHRLDLALTYPTQEGAQSVLDAMKKARNSS